MALDLQLQDLVEVLQPELVLLGLLLLVLLEDLLDLLVGVLLAPEVVQFLDCDLGLLDLLLLVVDPAH